MARQSLPTRYHCGMPTQSACTVTGSSLGLTTQSLLGSALTRCSFQPSATSSQQSSLHTRPCYTSTYTQNQSSSIDLGRLSHTSGPRSVGRASETGLELALTAELARLFKSTSLRASSLNRYLCNDFDLSVLLVSDFRQQRFVCAIALRVDFGQQMACSTSCSRSRFAQMDWKHQTASRKRAVSSARLIGDACRTRQWFIRASIAAAV